MHFLWHGWGGAASPFPRMTLVQQPGGSCAVCAWCRGCKHCPQSNCEHGLQPEASTQAETFLLLLSYSDKYHNSSHETSGQNYQTLTLLGCHRAVQYFNLIMATEEQLLGIRHFHLHPSPLPTLADVSCCMGERDLSHPQRKYHPLPETSMTRAG